MRKNEKTIERDFTFYPIINYRLSMPYSLPNSMHLAFKKSVKKAKS